MKRIKIKESDIRNIIRRIITENLDTYTISHEIIDRLERLGIEQKYLEQAMVALTDIESTKDPYRKFKKINNLKIEINKLLDYFNKGKTEDENNIIMSIDILLSNNTITPRLSMN